MSKKSLKKEKSDCCNVEVKVDEEKDSFLKRLECDGDECEREIFYMLHPHDNFGNSKIIKFACEECLSKTIKKIFEDAGDESKYINIHVSQH